MNVLIWILLAGLAALVGAEVIGWSDRAQRLLVRRAAAKLPPEHHDRYVEEWMAELNELPNAPLTRFVFASSLLIRRRRLASELHAHGSEAKGKQVKRDLLLAAEYLVREASDLRRAWVQGDIVVAEWSDGKLLPIRLKVRRNRPAGIRRLGVRSRVKSLGGLEQITYREPDIISIDALSNRGQVC